MHPISEMQAITKFNPSEAAASNGVFDNRDEYIRPSLLLSSFPLLLLLLMLLCRRVNTRRQQLGSQGSAG